MGGLRSPPYPPRDRVNESGGVCLSQRRQPRRVVGEHLGGHPAEPEHHKGPEHLVVLHADDHFRAAADHRLDEDPGKAVAELAR
jgi:hypothetical protein